MSNFRNPQHKHDIHRQHDDWDEVHNQLLAVQKKSLEVSNPNDADEQEADEVARKVSSGESAQIHGTGGTINRKGTGSAETTNEFQTKLESKKGAGQKLDDSTRTEMESKMGADFSNVNIHTGSEASNMSESINAKAFTHGQDVFFKDGEFDTGSKQGKELLAHELTHTVQQSGGKIQPKIQRKITITGLKDPYTPTADDYLKYDKSLLDQLDNGGKDPEYVFSSMSDFYNNVGIRSGIIKASLDVIRPDNQSVTFGFYRYNDNGKGEFRLPEKYWQRVNRKEYHMQTGDGITPADAVNSIFNNGNHETFLDCNMMLIAIQYKGILDAYHDPNAKLGEEDKRFNDMFPNGNNLIIGQNKEDDPKTPEKEGYQSTVSGSHPLFDQKLYTRIELAEDEDPFKKLIPGDWLYFKNAPDYLEYVDAYNKAMVASTLDPYYYTNYQHDAEWQGEHAIYLGERTIKVQEDDIQKDKVIKNGFAGFGLPQVESYDDMISMLKNACKFEYKSMQLMQKNDFTSDPNDLSDVSDSVIKGKPRISSIFRLNSVNIDALGK